MLTLNGYEYKIKEKKLAWLLNGTILHEEKILNLDNFRLDHFKISVHWFLCLRKKTQGEITLKKDITYKRPKSAPHKKKNSKTPQKQWVGLKNCQTWL